MEPPRRRRYTGAMTRRLLIGVTVLVAFVAFSLWVAATHGPLGFLALARDEPWALQLLIDLVIGCSFGLGWMWRDARSRGIGCAPFVALTLVCGSIGLLAYFVRRELATSAGGPGSRDRP